VQEKLSWGVIGTGGIAADFANALTSSGRCRIVNVVGSSPEKGRAFATKWSLPASSSTLEEFVADPAVEAVYVATPHPLHEAQTLACIEAGKHVLCEKPLTIDAASTERLIDAAQKRGIFLMEAFMYRCHPLMRELVARLKQGAIGTIRHVRADFGFRVPRDPKGRLFDPKLGGGGILDVGGYPVSLARLLAGIVSGAPFAEPIKIQAVGHIGAVGSDELAAALLTFQSGFTAEVACAVRYELGTHAAIFGEDGKIVLTDPWIPGSNRQGLESALTIHRDNQKPETVVVRTEKATYALEAELFADTLPGTQPPWPAASLADTLGNMRVLDAWQAELRK
jgi:predicted dehydrogenase